MVNVELINESIIKPLVRTKAQIPKDSPAKFAGERLLFASELKMTSLIDDAVKAMLYGDTLLLLENMKDVPDGLRTGRFVSAICVAYPDGSTVEAQGACEGHILREITGENGFGYDPIFEDIHGYKFGVVSAEIKDGVSHRRAALDALVKKLEERNKE